MNKLPIAALVLLSLLGCREPQVVARIGAYTITDRDVELRDAVQRHYYPNERRSVGLKQLVAAYTRAQILANNGRPIDDATLDREVRRIDESTQAPQRLRQIKRIFGRDEAAYRRVFVLPILAERLLANEFFPKSTEVQAPALEKARRLLDQTRKNPRSFRKIAGDRAVYRRLTVSKQNGLHWEGEDRERASLSQAPLEVTRRLREQRDEANARATRQWLTDVLPALKPGEIHGKVVDVDSRHFAVVRYVGRSPKDPETHEFEAALVEKVPFQPWLEAEAAKIRPFEVKGDATHSRR